MKLNSFILQAKLPKTPALGRGNKFYIYRLLFPENEQNSLFWIDLSDRANTLREKIVSIHYRKAKQIGVQEWPCYLMFGLRNKLRREGNLPKQTALSSPCPFQYIWNWPWYRWLSHSPTKVSWLSTVQLELFSTSHQVLHFYQRGERLRIFKQRK